MRMIEKVNNYLVDKEYKIIVKKNQVDIINYDEIVDFNLEKITLRHNKTLIIVEGKKLYISKMLDNEVLIKGFVFNIRIN